MIFNTNKERGNSGLALAIAYYGTKGYTVSIPLNDTQDYDLIVDNGVKLQTVQVKATQHKNNYGNYKVSVKSCGGTKGNIYKHVIDTNVDILFVVCEDMSMYEIPKINIHHNSAITLGTDFTSYKVYL